MSLIVTRKQGASIYIVGDTKLTTPDGQNLNNGYHFDQGENVIKTTILNKYQCVSFAGNVLYAEDALRRIGNDLNDEDILKILHDSHNESDQATDYTFASSRNMLSRIFEIKNGTISEVETSWIGSKRAFSKFQSNMLGQNKAERLKNFISITQADSGDLIQQMADAIDNVIQDDAIPEVAGFKIRVFYNGSQFLYDGYLNTYLTNQQLNFQIQSGQESFRKPITHGNAAQGGYTVNFFCNRDNYNYVGLHIKQGNFGILYKRINNGLLHPEMLRDIDEIDFWDRVSTFGVSPFGTTQDAFIKFGWIGKEYFDQKKYRDACDAFTKGIKYSYGKEKGQLYFNRAICQIHLNNMAEVLQDFNEAIKFKPEHQADANRIMMDLMNKNR